LPESSSVLRVEDFQNIVETIHMDNDEGVLYKVLKVYKKRDMAVVDSIDRVFYSPENPSDPGGTIDTVFLGDVVGYPVILGKENPRYQPPVPETVVKELAPLLPAEQALIFPSTVAPSGPQPTHETLQQKAKLLRSEAILAGEAKNTAENYARHSKRIRSQVHSSSAVTYRTMMNRSARLLSIGPVTTFPKNCGSL